MSNPTDPKIISAIVDFCQRPSAAVSVLEKIGNKKYAQAQQTVDPKVGLFKHMHIVYAEWTPEKMSDPIITEDIECEIIEPKKLEYGKHGSDKNDL